MNSIKFGICQFSVVADKHRNIAKAKEQITRAAQAGCQIAVLPEMFNCPYQADLFPLYAECYSDGPTVQMLADTAQQEKIAIIGGSIPEKSAQANVYNTCFIFDEAGRLIGRHRKVHLFDVEISGGTVFRESDTLTAGEELTVVNIAGIPIGIGICYDVRFIEMARAMTDAGAAVLVYPGAFGPVTGPAHWELLMRSRAVDNQVFVVAVSPSATLGASYQAYGHSLAVDPWGRILVEAGGKEALLVVECDLGQLTKVRSELPILRHRRELIYTTLQKEKL